MPKDLAHSFQCEEGQNIALNRRLPRIAQRDVLCRSRFEQFISHQGANHAFGPFAGAAS